MTKNGEVNNYAIIFKTDGGEYNLYCNGYTGKDLKNFLETNFEKVEYENLLG